MVKTELESGSLLHQYSFQVSGGTHRPPNQTFAAPSEEPVVLVLTRRCSAADETLVNSRTVCEAGVGPRLRMLRQTCVKQFMEGELVKENAAMCLPHQVYLSL